MKENEYIDWSGLKDTVLRDETFKNKTEIGTKLTGIYASRRRREKRRKWILQLVASFLILFAGSVSIYRLADQTIASKHRDKTINFPDGSSVILKPESSISYNRIEWFINRKLHLRGSGKFNIKPGRACSVYTPDITVAVLGTVFEINKQGRSTEVICERGRVKVFNHLVSKNLLQNESIQVNASGYDFTTTDTIILPQERPVNLIYEAATLENVIADLNRCYHCQITADSSIMNELFSGVIPDDNLDQALTIISACCDLTYKKEGTRICLSK